MNTIEQVNKVLEKCKTLFEKKLQDYGPSWRLLRLPSITDLVYIKVNRIRTIEITGIFKVNEPIEEDFIAIINYSLVALIQIKLGITDKIDITNEHAMNLYNEAQEEAKNLMLRKNHDYGEAWRQMRVSSFVDIILTKVFRIKQIEDNQGKTIVSEGIASNFLDIINYSIFALIKLEEKNNII